MQDLKHDIHIALLSDSERLIVATALGYGLAVTQALEREPGVPLAPEGELDGMRMMIEAMVPDDAELERILRATRWRVGNLVGHWPKQRKRP